MASDAGAKDAVGRLKLQNFTSFPCFLRQDHWDRIEAVGPNLDPAFVLQELADHLVSLGLKFPSEPTLCMVYAVMNFRNDTMWQYGSTSYVEYQNMKQTFRACLSRSRGSLKVIPGPYLLQLPLTFDGLPQDLASRVFQDQPPVPSRYDMAELLQLVKLSPMRNTHRLVDNRITGSKVQGIPGIFSLLQQALGQPLGPAAPSRGSLRLQNGETLPLITGPAPTVAPSLPRGVSWSSGSAKDRCLPDVQNLQIAPALGAPPPEVPPSVAPPPEVPASVAPPSEAQASVAPAAEAATSAPPASATTAKEDTCLFRFVCGDIFVSFFMLNFSFLIFVFAG